MSRTIGIVLVLLFIVCFSAYSQADTVYVLFEESQSSIKKKIGTGNELRYSLVYTFSKPSSHYTGLPNELRFVYSSAPFFGSGTLTGVFTANKNMFESNELLGIDWFEANSYADIIEFMSPKELVIFLIDKSESTENQFYLRRVSFWIDARE